MTTRLAGKKVLITASGQGIGIYDRADHCYRWRMVNLTPHKGE